MFDIENVNRTTSQPPETFKMVKKKYELNKNCFLAHGAYFLL